MKRDATKGNPAAGDGAGREPGHGKEDVTALGSTLGTAAHRAAQEEADYLGTMPGTLMETLGIRVLQAEPERVVATMPVTSTHHQPYGILHGGASVALAETVASIGATLLPGGARQRAVGLEINANHVRAVRAGTVTAVATPLHKGRSTQVWSVEIRDGEGRLICVSRCTLAVLEDGGDDASR